MTRRERRVDGRGRTFGIVGRAGSLVIAGTLLATFASSFGASAATAGGQSSPPAGSDQASFLKALAGPSEAPMYPSGLIWDPSFPTAGGPIPAVVVADTGYNRVTIFDPTDCPMPDTSTCAPIETFGSYGSDNGQFNTDRDVAVDGNSNIYVADAANGRIEAFNAAGTWLWTAGDANDCGSVAACKLSTPIGISYDATTNEVLVADTGHSEIKAFAAVGGAYGLTAGTYIWDSPAGVVASPREARRGPDGEIWVADYHDEEVRAFQCTCTSSASVGTAWVTTANKVIGDGLDAGHNDGEVNSPYNIAFSPDGTIGYVADTGNERIGVFDITDCTGTLNGQANECTFLKNYGARCPNPCPEPPDNAGFFDALRRVTVDPATGDIWAADFWGSGIHEFSPTGSTSGMYEIDGSPAPASGFAEAYGVAVGPDGTTYVADRLNQRILEFAVNGTVNAQGSRGVAPGQYSWPEAVAVTPDKTVWVGDTRNNRLQHFTNADLTGTPTIVGSSGIAPGQFNYIEGVSAAADGKVWIADTDNNRVQSYNPATQNFAVFGTAGSTPNTNQLFDPESVVASANDIYIADTGNNRVVELDLSGNYVASYTGLDQPQGVALAPDGSIWVANTGASQTDSNGNDIIHLSSSLTPLGGGFGAPGDGNMQFFEPHSLAVSPDGTTLFVADTYNNRVQEFSIATQLVFTVEPGGAGGTGDNLTPQPVVTVEDTSGNTVTSDTGSVTLALTGGPPGANLTCTSGLTVAEVNGVASFSGCSVDTAGTYTLTASDGSLPWSSSSSFTVGTSGSPAQLAFTPSPGGAARGAPLSPQPVVSIEDSGGSTVGTDSSHVTISLNGPGTLTCADAGDLTVQAVHGVATFSGCSVNTVANGDTLTATDTDDSLPSVNSGSFNITLPASQAPYTAITPFRVCDTRPATGGVQPNQCNTGSTGAGMGPITELASRVITIRGFGSPAVPADAVAVVLNVTAIAPTKNDFVTLYPDLQARPNTSNLDLLANQVRANLVEVQLSSAGKIDVFNDQGTINVALDIEGFVSPGSSTAKYNPLAAPVRICDTRAATGSIPANQCNTSGHSPILGSGPVLTFNVHTATDGVPSTGVEAVVFNLTAITPSVRTDLTAYPAGVAEPLASNVNVEAGTAVPNRVIVGVSGSGTVSIANSVGSVDVAIDIDGYFASTGADFQPLTPARICNTQFGNPGDSGCNKAFIGPGGVLNIDVAGIDGVSASASAVVVNVTAVNATTGTLITVYPGTAGLHQPNASDLNVGPTWPVANLVVVGVDATTGTINLYNNLGNVNLIVDVYGYYN